MGRAKQNHRKPERERSWPSVVWGLFFSLNDRFITYQQRRNWRARASFFFVLGVLVALGVGWLLARRFGLCPK
jgi:hypothetical protein